MNIIRFFSNPRVVVVLFVIFLVGYLIFIDEEGGFADNFTTFGPSDSRFMLMKLDTWTKVIVVYFVSFFSAMMTTYYDNVMESNIHSYLWNPAIKKVPFSKTWTYIIVFLEPVFMELLGLITLMASLTLQLQFILPELIGSMLAETPFVLQILGTKKFMYT
jgi:hypothetical protein